VVIDFYGRAPLKATPDMWTDKVIERLPADMWALEGQVNQMGYLSVTVPGTLMALHDVASRFASMPWKELLAPAIELAETGFTVQEELAASLLREGMLGYANTEDILMATPGSARVFAPNGRLIEAGDTFAMKDYAETLRRVAEEGPDLLYKGEMGRAIAEDFARNGGLITEEDFRGYQIRVNPPIQCDYRGYTICGNLPPGSGPQIIETLNILEGYDLAGMGFGTPEYCHVMAQAQKAGFADRARYLADPDFESVPVEKLVSKEHAGEWRERIDAGEEFQVPGLDLAESKDTTTVSVMDEEGNAIAITHTLGSPCSGVVVEGLGFLFNNSMHVFHPFPGHPNSIAPGKARTTGMSPTIVMKDDKPLLVTSAPGAVKILTGNLQTIVNVVDHGMSAVEAVSAPRIHSEGRWVDVEARLYYGIKDEMERRGHRLKRSSLSYDGFFSLVHAVHRDPETGRISGGADPRGRGGHAEVR
jgi:gamma-glutamyltranspeptidase/glutathione hydrolase